MRFGKLFLGSALILTTSLPALAMTHARRGPTSPKLFNKKAKSSSKLSGQRAIDDSRATQIQGALVKSGYLGEGSGHWDAETQNAMQKFQADNGWQTKLIPDSRAIIKLGLGPSQNLSASSAPLTPPEPSSPR
jgi:hypothetical protein